MSPLHFAVRVTRTPSRLHSQRVLGMYPPDRVAGVGSRPGSVHVCECSCEPTISGPHFEEGGDPGRERWTEKQREISV